MSFFSDLFKSPEKTSTQTQTLTQLPDYAEATGARQNWWDTLQKWGGQPGYGAIAPNWNDIWENARGKVQRYFMGGPEGPGLNAQVRANLARRGMSEQPAAETLLQRSGFQQGNMLQDMAVQQAIQEAQFGEQGRRDWLTSLMQLAGLKPSFGGGTTTRTDATEGGMGWDILGALGGGAMSMFGANQQNKLLDKYLSGMGGGDDTGIGDIDMYEDSESGFGDFGLDDIGSIASLAMMFI